MIDLKKKYSFDKKKAKEGVKFFIGTDKSTDWVLIRRLPNEDYLQLLTSVMQDNGDRLAELKDSDEEAYKELDMKLQCEILAKTTIIDWGEGIQENGKPIPYSVEKAAQLLFDFDDFRIDCTVFARERKNFQPKMDIEKVKKS